MLVALQGALILWMVVWSHRSSLMDMSTSMIALVERLLNVDVLDELASKGLFLVR